MKKLTLIIATAGLLMTTTATPAIAVSANEAKTGTTKSDSGKRMVRIDKDTFALRNIVGYDDPMKEYFGNDPNICDRIVKSWRPVFIHKEFSITCDDDSEMMGAAGLTYIGWHVDDTGFWYYRPIKIKLLRGMSKNKVKEVLTHEAYHYLNYSWSPVKQKNYLKRFNLTEYNYVNWMEDWEGYLKDPSEQWAGMATQCAGFKGSNQYYPLAGGCLSVKRWAGFSWNYKTNKMIKWVEPKKPAKKPAKKTVKK